ncbi:hypothetical protein [Pseudomaricurvus alcaniphilus]|uniref:hypothetical protein n=1 Tax=Pseudomaricurvus alcaniphilus TaxID=1166482 RepID=UPI001FB5AB5D|nr:hypothetical protein [Pseudomaricurvus alcaniphilus]
MPLNRNTAHGVARLLVASLALGLGSPGVSAGVREQAKVMHDRLAGVPPSQAVLLDMAADLEAGDYTSAAYTAMDNEAFLAVTLKNWITPWTNRDQDVFRDLNDYTATVIGVIRDERDFREILYSDILYTADPDLGLAAYSNSNNTQYQQLETQGLPLSTALVPVQQSQVNGLPEAATAGVMTSRAAAKEFFIAGTNRAMFRFTLLNHLCVDLEQVKDTSRPPDRIRQDVSRSPGGDSRVFLNNCIACHSGMDPMAQAFAYYDFEFNPGADPDAVNGSIHYNGSGDIDAATGTRVEAKYHINSANFSYGFVTPDDRWDNYWRQGPNRNLGWDSGLPGSGSGAKSMGMELAHSEAFAQCQVKKVFRAVCLREPGDADDRSHLSGTTALFQDGYNLKKVFAETANYCKQP